MEDRVMKSWLLKKGYENRFLEVVLDFHPSISEWSQEYHTVNLKEFI